MKLKFANLSVSVKAINEEEHSLQAVFSTGDVDRHGEIVDQKSWQLENFIKNPVVLFGHDHGQPPIGRVLNIGYNGEGNLEGTVQFAAEEYDFANTIWQLYKSGYMRAFSVGFSAGDIELVEGQIILKNNELYELSAVAVPANAMALAKSKGIDTTPLEQKQAEMEVEAKCEECGKEEKECPCKKKPEAEAPVEEPKEEEKVEEAPVEAPVEEQPEEEVAAEDVAKSVAELATSIKEGRVLSKKNRTAIEDAIVALKAVLEADTPSEEDKGEEPAVEKQALDTSVKQPAVSFKNIKTLPKKSRNRAINKAIRGLLKAKKK